MEIGYIGKEQLDTFSTLFLPQIVDAIIKGEPVTALGAVKDKVAVGAVAGYLEDSVYKIISLYVAPDYRRQGVARKLLEKLEEFLLTDKNITAMEINYTVTEQEHSELKPFCEKLGFEEEEQKGETLYTFTLAQAAASPLFKAGEKSNSHILPFRQLSEKLLREAQREAVLLDVPVPEAGLLGGEVDRDLSHALVDEGRIVGCVVFDRSLANLPTLACVWTNKAEAVVLPALLKRAFQSASERYSEETVMAVQAVNPASAALLQNILPQASPFSFTYRRVW